MSVARKPWVVAITRYVPGPGAAGSRPREAAHVFDSEDEFNRWLNVGENRRVVKVIYGDPRGAGAGVDGWDMASDAVWLHEGEK